MSEKRLNFKYCDEIVEKFEKVVKKPKKTKSKVYYTGVDLGTACVVIAVLDENFEDNIKVKKMLQRLLKLQTKKKKRVS